MSYILDALKKAERERGMTQVPTLSTVHDIDEKTSGRFRFLAIAVLMLLAAGSGLTLFLWDRGDKHPAAEFHINTEQQPGQKIPASGNNDTNGRETDMSSLALSQSGQDRYAAPKETPEINSGISSSAAPRNTSGRFPVAGQETPAAAIPPQGRQKAVSPEFTPPASTENALQISNLSSGEAGPSDPRNQSFDITNRESTLQQAMETMRISILLYAETPSDRLVFINGRKYAEGDYVDGRFLLETITPDGAVLTYEGAKAVLEPKAD